MRRLVGATLCIKTGIGQAEALHGAAVEQMFGHDFLHIPDVDKAVPDSLGIDDNDRAVFALVKAARLICADMVLHSGILDGIFERGFQLFAAAGQTTGTGGGLVPLVGANEDVVVEPRQLRVSLLFGQSNRAAQMAF